MKAMNRRQETLNTLLLGLNALLSVAVQAQSSAVDVGTGTALAVASSARGEWPGDSGRSGVNGDPIIDRASVEAFCTWRGRACGLAHVYTNRADWNAMTRGSGWLFDNFAGFPGQLVISQALVPENASADMNACAHGLHDQDFRDFGSLMVSKGRGASIVRLGWEFNDPSKAWAATDATQWKQCFRHAATAIRSTNPDVRIDWTVNSHATPANLCGGSSANCYPGDPWVDIIGVDSYDWGPSASTESAFQQIASGPDGLTSVYSFAKAHAKPMSVGEWGVAPGSPNNTLGENPQFIRFMHDWFAAHAADLAYEAYFNDCAAGVESNLYLPTSSSCGRQNVAAGEVYKSLFGTGAGTSVTPPITTPPVATAPAASGAWPGAFGKSGVNGDPSIDSASVEAFCSWRGRTCGIAHVYTDRSSWSKMMRGSGWVFDNFASFPGQLVISQGLVPDGAAGDLKACAAGDHDQDFRDFGALMVQKGRGASIVRLGWEFNGTFMTWAATNADQWIQCYRHAANAIRAGNPGVTLDWTINAHGTPSNVCGGRSTNCYPGDAWVDIIGIDNYDHAPSASSDADFARIAAAPDGLSWIYDFAKQHGKRISVGEWGVAPTSDYNNSGENPNFIRWMHDWFAAHAADLAYEAYFNDCEAGVGSNLYRPVSSGCARQNVAAAALYRSLFGN
jgi:beta-mannanase